MQIRVDKDNLRIIKLSQLESGEVDVTEVDFIFTPEYKDLSKVAVFTLGDKSYKVILQNDKCYIPGEVLVEGNKITIGVYAFKSEGEELILRYSPVPVTAEILKGSYIEEAENTSHPTPTEIEQLLELILTNKNSIDNLSDRVDTLEEDKDKCERDIDSIKDDIFDIKSDIQDLEEDVTSIRSDINNINENIDDIESEIDDINGDISNINTSITNIERVDERQTRRLNAIDNFIRQWPKTEYQTGTNINLGKTIQAPVEYENGIVIYGNAEQEGTPTPESPIPISVVTGTQEVVVRGGNTFSGTRLDNLKVADLTGNDLGNYPITLKAGTYHKFIVFTDDTKWVQDIVFQFKDNANNVIVTKYSTSDFTLTKEEASQITKLQLWTNATSRELYADKTIKGLLISQEISTYEPYITPTTYTLHLGNMEFASIGNYVDDIEFNLDEGKWYKKKAINKRTFTGTTETIVKSTDSGFVRYDIRNISDMVKITSRFEIISNYFHYMESGREVGACFGYYTNNGSFYFYPEQTLTEVADFKTWLSTHNTIVYYPLETPRDEEITDTTLIADLDNIYAMMSVEGTTIIEVSGNISGIIKVKAFAQLQAAT